MTKVKKVDDEVRIQALVDGKRVNIKESSIRRTLRLDNAEGTTFLTNAKSFEGLARMGYEKPSYKLTFYKAFLSPMEVPDLHYLAMPYCKDSLKLQKLKDLCTNLSNKVLDLESEVLNIKSTYKAKIKKLESTVDMLEEENWVLKELMGVHSKVDYDELVMEKEESSKQRRKIADIDADVEINLKKAQVKAYNLDLDHQEKVLSMLDVNDEEHADVKEVLEVVTTTMLITEVVTTAKMMLLLLKQLKQEKEVEVESSKREGESLEQEIAKKQNIEQETKELKKHLQLTPDDDDDVYTDATLLVLKILIIDYKIYTERNRPHFKIIRADGNHRERFANTEPKNYLDDYLLRTLKIMFEKPNVKANV
nr:hypothetical protein [Tanacetum cinerariifolium]